MSVRKKQELDPMLGSKTLVFQFNPRDCSFNDQTGELIVDVPVMKIPTDIRVLLKEIGMSRAGIHAVMDQVDHQLTLQWIDEHILVDH